MAYVISAALHHHARGRVNQARTQIAGGDWLAAIRTLDRALWDDPFVAEAHLLRAAAIHGHIEASEGKRRFYSREDALRDLDREIRYRPDSLEARYQRGLALAALSRVNEAREELARVIPVLEDPTDALVERAALSFHAHDYEAAIQEISAAIERRPLVVEYYANRGFYRRFSGDLEGGREDLLREAMLREGKVDTVEALEASVRAQNDRHTITALQDSSAITAERSRFFGRWQVIARESHGDSIDTSSRDFHITFEVDRYRLVLDGKIQQDAPFLVDDNARPRRIDWNATIRGRETTVLGVYEFRGDTLLICMANEGEARPVKFTATVDDRVVLYTLRRRLSRL
jgi:uncharacterized protein (TIGR03067 family)